MTLPERIIEIAKNYIGETEIPNNSGFTNANFQKLLAARGWEKGQSWCAYFAYMVWFDAFSELDPVGAKLLPKYANGSSLQTYFNFQKSKEFHVQVNPVPGAIVCFREGNSTSGHEGIVTSFDAMGFNFTSGNTSVTGSREGTTVFDKYRRLHLPYNSNRLNLLGFVNPIRIS